MNECLGILVTLSRASLLPLVLDSDRLIVGGEASVKFVEEDLVLQSAGPLRWGKSLCSRGPALTLVFFFFNFDVVSSLRKFEARYAEPFLLRWSLLPLRQDSFMWSLLMNFHFFFSHKDFNSLLVSGIFETTSVSCLAITLDIKCKELL